MSGSVDTAPVRLRVSGVQKGFGHIQALAEANLSIRAGEVVALLGANGAGKSTLVKLLAGLQMPDDGVIELDGEQVVLNGSASAQARGIAVVNQEFSLVAPMSVAENLALGQVDTGRVWGRKRLLLRARALLEAVGLDDIDPRARVEELGVAERQLVEIARVVSKDARVVIFDEPTAALSGGETHRVQKIVRDIAARGCSVIYVTHRLGEVFEIADTIQVLRNGRTLAPVRVEEVDVQQIVTMMLGRDLGELYPPRALASPGDVLMQVSDLEGPGLTSPVSFSVQAGQILGLTGQLGSGAGAVLAALSGTIKGTGGRLELAGEQVPLRGRRDGIEAGLAYCSADRKRDGIFAELSAADNLSSPWLSRVASRGWVSREAQMTKAREVAVDFAFDPERLHSGVGTLSGGNQQKIALGKWLGIEPRVFLADEPTRGVDVGARAEIYRRLRRLADEGAAVVIASTDVNEVLGMCDVVSTFHDGALTQTRAASQWTEHELLLEVMHEPTGDRAAAGVLV